MPVIKSEYKYSVVADLKWLLSTCVLRPRLTLRALNVFVTQHRIGRCLCCNRFTILYNAPIAYSIHYAFLCSEHAAQEAEETDIAWRNYYSDCL